MSNDVLVESEFNLDQVEQFAQPTPEVLAEYIQFAEHDAVAEVAARENGAEALADAQLILEQEAGELITNIAVADRAVADSKTARGLWKSAKNFFNEQPGEQSKARNALQDATETFLTKGAANVRARARIAAQQQLAAGDISEEQLSEQALANMQTLFTVDNEALRTKVEQQKVINNNASGWRQAAKEVAGEAMEWASNRHIVTKVAMASGAAAVAAATFGAGIAAVAVVGGAAGARRAISDQYTKYTGAKINNHFNTQAAAYRQEAEQRFTNNAGVDEIDENILAQSFVEGFEQDRRHEKQMRRRRVGAFVGSAVAGVVVGARARDVFKDGAYTMLANKTTSIDAEFAYGADGIGFHEFEPTAANVEEVVEEAPFEPADAQVETGFVPFGLVDEDTDAQFVPANLDGDVGAEATQEPVADTQVTPEADIFDGVTTAFTIEIGGENGHHTLWHALEDTLADAVEQGHDTPEGPMKIADSDAAGQARVQRALQIIADTNGVSIEELSSVHEGDTFTFELPNQLIKPEFIEPEGTDTNQDIPFDPSVEAPDEPFEPPETNDDAMFNPGQQPEPEAADDLFEPGDFGAIDLFEEQQAEAERIATEAAERAKKAAEDVIDGIIADIKLRNPEVVIDSRMRAIIEASINDTDPDPVNGTFADGSPAPAYGR